MTKPISEAAKVEACELVNKVMDKVGYWTVKDFDDPLRPWANSALFALARYIDEVNVTAANIDGMLKRAGFGSATAERQLLSTLILPEEEADPLVEVYLELASAAREELGAERGGRAIQKKLAKRGYKIVKADQ